MPLSSDRSGVEAHGPASAPPAGHPNFSLFRWFSHESPAINSHLPPLTASPNESHHHLNSISETAPLSDEAVAALEAGTINTKPEAIRKRKDSSSLSHDEALNLSRAGLSYSPFAKDIAAQALEGKNPMRRRSNSRYDKLGLMAAYSGGPSSF